MLEPVLQQRLKALKSDFINPSPDLIQLIIDDAPETTGRSIEYHTNAQINTGRAALFATATTAYQVFCHLVTHPEYVDPLRQEVLDLGDEPFNRVNLARLVKLDSFIRECQRWSSLILRKHPVPNPDLCR